MKHWFSAKVRLICLIENKGATRYMDSLLLFRAADFASAFDRALSLGKNREQAYENEEHLRVVWRLVEVISLDQLATDDLDGTEVYSEPVALTPGGSISFDTEFKPERSRPTQTI